MSNPVSFGGLSTFDPIQEAARRESIKLQEDDSQCRNALVVAELTEKQRGSPSRDTPQKHLTVEEILEENASVYESGNVRVYEKSRTLNRIEASSVTDRETTKKSSSSRSEQFMVSFPNPFASSSSSSANNTNKMSDASQTFPNTSFPNTNGDYKQSAIPYGGSNPNSVSPQFGSSSAGGGLNQTASNTIINAQTTLVNPRSGSSGSNPSGNRPPNPIENLNAAGPTTTQVGNQVQQNQERQNEPSSVGHHMVIGATHVGCGEAGGSTIRGNPLTGNNPISFNGNNPSFQSGGAHGGIMQGGGMNSGMMNRTTLQNGETTGESHDDYYYGRSMMGAHGGSNNGVVSGGSNNGMGQIMPTTHQSLQPLSVNPNTILRGVDPNTTAMMHVQMHQMRTLHGENADLKRRLERMEHVAIAGGSAQRHQPIIIQNHANATTETKIEKNDTDEGRGCPRGSDGSLSGLVWQVYNDVMVHLESPFNRLCLLGLFGTGLYLYNQHLNHSWRMSEMQRKIDANFALKFCQWWTKHMKEVQF